jgi:hypothetical protein
MTDNAASRSRWRPFISFAVVFALVALLAPVFPRQPSSHIRARFDQIENGMPEEQVGDLLGGPRGVYDETRRYRTMTTAAGTGSPRSHLSWWYFPDCDIEVGFGEDGRVNGKRIETPPPQSLFGRTVRWCERTFSSPSP